MNKVKVTLLSIAIIWFGLLSVVLLIGEPAEGGAFDLLEGVVLMKFGGIVSLVLASCAWEALPKDIKDRIHSWIKLHF